MQGEAPVLLSVTYQRFVAAHVISEIVIKGS